MNSFNSNTYFPVTSRCLIICNLDEKLKMTPNFKSRPPISKIILQPCLNRWSTSKYYLSFQKLDSQLSQLSWNLSQRKHTFNLTDIYLLDLTSRGFQQVIMNKTNIFVLYNLFRLWSSIFGRCIIVKYNKPSSLTSRTCLEQLPNRRVFCAEILRLRSQKNNKNNS